ncbi:MAG: tyrosine-type recombinase/integrase, partial [Desulfovibrio sp.]|nr:tyrosine-type recombinase/integrase [Desulfovibrio sp.]
MKAGIPLVCHRGGSKVLSFRPAWLNACKKAGVVMRPYDIRHIAATEMLARGADLAAVAARLGHTNVAATGAFYAHVTAGSQSRAAALMPSLDDEKMKTAKNERRPDLVQVWCKIFRKKRVTSL